MLPNNFDDANELMEGNVNIDAVCKALAEPIRRSLLKILGEKQYFCYLNGEMVNGVCVQDLSALLKLPQSTISRHLAILRQAGLVGHQQKGVWHYYFCRSDTLRTMNRWLQSLMPSETNSGGDVGKE
ncbi:ArsR/SmtB family transcription factor [Alicyclobacillus tolerans]|uniref:ArsR family transcriptional regulator n=1 Tax=Alicyclobacillus tolerans TaxID=90970 RepID=A0A1M6Y9T0_9BACL|nr:metalloregulator ArsR/SmtB family transcription factor [Alicyclobacillus montanus]SHL15011.1 ArsR family transcriptional regulator [Alicyclobacillus montanus]